MSLKAHAGKFVHVQLLLDFVMTTKIQNQERLSAFALVKDPSSPVGARPVPPRTEGSIEMMTRCLNGKVIEKDGSFVVRIDDPIDAASTIDVDVTDNVIAFISTVGQQKSRLVLVN